METTALIIGYAILGILSLAIILFALALGWFAITEARGIIYSRKWRKHKLKQLKYEMARDCAAYLCRWDLPSDMNVYRARDYFTEKLKKE